MTSRNPKINKDKDLETIEPVKVKIPNPQRISASHNGMVSTAHFKATDAGRMILGHGGNAVDAAVASAFALGVCEPQASGLGGQTMMLIHLAESKETFALDGSSRAPNRALVEDYSNKNTRLMGYRATTVPSTPAVLAYALERYGSLPLDQVMAPAIALAEDGYPITDLQRSLQRRELDKLKKGNAGKIFLTDEARPYRTGALFKQPILAGTYRRLAEAGIEDFYTGDIARTIVQDMEKSDGLIHADDLAQIPYPIEREVISCPFGSMRVMTMPPPGAGLTVAEMLKIMRRFPAKDRNPDTPKGALILAEVIRRAQLDRRDRPFDPNFYPQVLNSKVLSDNYAKLVGDQIKARLKVNGETTHVSAMDRWGNAVALTQSIELVYGSKAATPELGFIYNNYMNAFEYKDISHPYYLRPNAVPWASVAPTIIFKKAKPWLVIGSPGSERIASTILQIVLRLARQSPFDAVAAPRLHCSVTGKVSIEAAYMRDDIPLVLEKHGFTVDKREPMSFYLGCVQMVLQENDEFIGVADPRRDGSAGGPII